MSSSTFSSCGAKTMYIFRQSLIGTTAPFLSSKVCVKSSGTSCCCHRSQTGGRLSARAPLESLPAPNRHTAERMPMSQEDAVQIPEFPVPRCGAAAEDEGDRDAASARAAAPCLRVNHTALVRTKSAGNGSTRRVDDVRELLRHLPSLRLPGHEGATRVAHRYAGIEPRRAYSHHSGLLLIRASAFDPDFIRGRAARRALHR